MKKVLVAFIIIASAITCCKIHENEKERIERNKDNKQIDYISNLLVKENNPNAIDDALLVCTDYEDTENEYSIIQKKIAKLEKKKLTQKIKNQLTENYQRSNSLINMINEYSAEYHAKKEFLDKNNIDIEFYKLHKEDIKNRYDDYINGTVKEFEEVQGIVWYLKILIVLASAIIICILIFAIPAVFEKIGQIQQEHESQRAADEYQRSIEERCKNLSKKLYENRDGVIDFSKIDEAIEIKNNYYNKSRHINYLEGQIHKLENQIKTITSKKLELNKEKKISELKMKISEIEAKIEKEENDDIVEEQEYANNLLYSFNLYDEINFYEENKDKIQSLYRELVKSEEENRQQQMQAEIEQQKERIAKRDAEDIISDKKEALINALKRLQDTTNILQVEVDKSGNLERDYLQRLTSCLEAIENNLDLLDDKIKSALKRNYELIKDTFKRAKNIKQLKANVNVIKGIFKKLV